MTPARRLLPGQLRAAVAGARGEGGRPPQDARKAAAGRARRGRPGRAGAGRRAAGPPRPALRLPRARRRWPTGVVPGLAGQGPLRRPGRRRLRRSTGSPRATTPAGSRPLRRVVSAEPVLTPRGRRADRPRRRAVRRHPLRRAAARRPAPARHRREGAVAGRRRAPDRRPGRRPRRPGPATSPARAFLAAPRRRGRRRGRSGRPRPATTGRALLAHAAAATLAAGRGALLVRARPQDLARVDAALTARPRRGPPRRADRRQRARRARYRDFLAVSRGARRSWSAPARPRSRRSTTSAWWPIWDDGDDLHAEPRAPYPHTREVLLLRAERRRARRRCVGGFARTVEAAYLLRTGWAREIAAARATSCATGVTVAVAGDRDRELRARPARPRGPDPERRPTTRSASGLEHGPGAGADPARRLRRQPGLRALPHAGPLRGLPRARCARPGRPRRRPAAGAAQVDAGLGLRRVRRPRAAGAGRGRGAAPPRSSAARSPASPVRTLQRRPRARRRSTPSPRSWSPRPGAEPVAEGGYAAVVLLDTWLLLGPGRPARRGGGAAPLVQRRRAGPPPGGRVRRRRRPGRPGAAGAGALGPGRLRRAARPTERRDGPPAAGVAGWRPSPASPAPSTTRSPCSSCPTAAEVLGPVAGRGRRPTRRVAGRRPGAARARAPPCRARSASCSGSARPASSTPVRVQVDPLVAGLTVDCAPLPTRGGPCDRPAHPPLRRPGAAHAAPREVVDFDKELRRLVAGPHRHDARRPGRRPGRAADRRRAAGLHLARRRRGRPPGQPRRSTLSEEIQDGPEGCLSIPELTYRLHARAVAWSPAASTCTASR